MRVLMFLHRWLGVAAALLVFVWFASGIVMMYHRYPEVTPGDRLRRAADLDAASFTLSADEAAARMGRPGEAPARVTTFDRRPVYQYVDATVFADDGSVLTTPDAAVVRRAAADWVGSSTSGATHDVVTEPDQWTLGGEVQQLLPLDRFSWPDGQQVYVDRQSGTVVQHTTSASRLWAYLGAIPHWMYVTPLRTSSYWADTVIWSASLALAVAVAGILLAVTVWSPRHRYRRDGMPATLPYRGWKRWHTVAGLLFGVVTVTWSFSGLLSMGPFHVIDRLVLMTPPASGDEPAVDAALLGRGLALEAYAGRPVAEVIGSLAGFGVKELEYVSIAGQPVFLASNGDGDTRVVPMQGPPLASFDVGRLMARIRDEARGPLVSVQLLHAHDRYYLDRGAARPLPVILARFGDAAGTRVYINPRTATIVTTYTAGDRVARWLYHGLHSLDFPWLYRYRPLWDIVVIALLLGGGFVSATAVVLAWRVLWRTVAGRAAGRSAPGRV